ncbi:MAG: RQC-minor-1 family DNA-binding protein [Coriobacteriia bacterium]|nr:RQC-minor-1 family DNA-binding protein [Coriobacteriia bacterium]
MGKKDRPRSPVRLNAAGASVTPEELAIVLHGADSVVNRGGRNQLVKLLKGSRDKRILELGLDADVSYGKLSHLTLDEIARKVDWTIEKGYLDYYYEWRQPLLTFTALGWELERPVVENEYFEQFCRDVEDGEFRMAERMADIKNEVQLGVIELIAERCDEGCFENLEAWKSQTTRRIRKKINWAQQTIRSREADGESGRLECDE